MSIKAKIILIAIIPLVALGVFAVSGITEKKALSSELARLQTLAVATIKVSDFVHESQKERGRTGVFIGSKGEKFSEELKAQRQLTDDTHKALDDALRGFDVASFDPQFQSALKKAEQKEEELREHRIKVDALSISGQEGISFYTELNALMIDLVRTISRITVHGDVARQVSAYVNFMEAKEKAGIERATMSVVFAEDNFKSLEVFNRFSAAVTAQKTLLNVFLSYANPEQIDFYDTKMSDPVVGEVESLREVAFAKFTEKSLGHVDAARWFDLMTSKINLMKEVENKLALDLNNLSTAISADAQKIFQQYIYGTIFSIIVTLLLVVYVLVSIFRPLRILQNGADRIKRGDLNYRTNIRTNDELGQFSKTFDQMAASLTETSKYLVSIFRSMPSLLAVVNTDGTIKEVNVVTMSLLGYEEKELIGQQIDKILAKDSGFSGKRMFLELKEKGGMKDLIINYFSKQGEKIPVAVSGASVKDEKGNIVYGIFIAKDMREIRQYAKDRLAKIIPILQQVSLGNFSRSIDIPDQEDEFTEYLVALKIMTAELKRSLRDNEDNAEAWERQGRKLIAASVALEEAKTNLEVKIKERTAELQTKTDEFEQMNKFMINREVKMAELKQEIAKLSKTGVINVINES